MKKITGSRLARDEAGYFSFVYLIYIFVNHFMGLEIYYHNAI